MSIGFHVGSPLVDNISGVMKDMKMKVCQIFTHGPRNLSKNTYDAEKLAEVAKGKIKIYVHSAYVTKWTSTGTVFMQLDACDEIGALGLVLHIPSVDPRGVASLVHKMTGRYKTPLLLEMRAMHSTATSYESPDKLKALVKALQEAKITKEQARICIDTAHIYAGGMDIKTPMDASRYLNDLHDIWDWIGLLHLNGNRIDRSVAVRDEHTAPGGSDDAIWGGLKYKDSGCRVFVEEFFKRDIDIILEQKIDSRESSEFYKLITNSTSEGETKVEKKTEAATTDDASSDSASPDSTTDDDTSSSPFVIKNTTKTLSLREAVRLRS